MPLSLSFRQRKGEEWGAGYVEWESGVWCAGPSLHSFLLSLFRWVVSGLWNECGGKPTFLHSFHQCSFEVELGVHNFPFCSHSTYCTAKWNDYNFDFIFYYLVHSTSCTVKKNDCTILLFHSRQDTVKWNDYISSYTSSLYSEVEWLTVLTFPQGIELNGVSEWLYWNGYMTVSLLMPLFYTVK